MLGGKDFKLFAIGLSPQRRNPYQISSGFHPYDIAKLHRLLFAFWRVLGVVTPRTEAWAKREEEETYVRQVLNSILN